ncbi:MAG: GntR family transcriptional regulator [Verrucomicrobiota bacterium]
MTAILTPRDQIINELRGRLLAREWPPGTRLKEHALVREFGVGRGPIRDVLLELTKEGYLRMLPNRGVTVGGFPDSPARPVYVETRRELESLALRRGYPRWPADAMARLERILQHFELAAQANQLPEVIEHDMAFHRFLITQYPEEDLSVVWLPLMTTLALPYSRHANLMQSYQEHANIVALLCRGELEAAIAALRTHIQ